jgi:cytochrome c5
VLLRLAVFLPLTLVLLAADASKLPEGDGKTVVEGACASCHSLEIVNGKKWDQAKWTEVVTAMKVRGASLDKQDVPRIAAYLSKNFGPKDKGQELVEGICTLCHELARVKKQQYTKDEWANTIRGMIEEGAPVTDEEFSLIVNYLTKNYGPPPQAR